MERNRKLVDIFYEKLLEEDTIDGPVVHELKEKYGDYDAFRPSLDDLREKYFEKYHEKKKLLSGSTSTLAEMAGSTN